jgi:hypothetical protein
MATGESAEGWYVRSRGRVQGPMTWGQLQAMRQRGQLARFDQLSRDGRTWGPADGVEGLFPRAGTAFAAPPGDRSSGKRATGSPETVGFLILDDEPESPGPSPGRMAAPAVTGSHGSATGRLSQPEPAVDLDHGAWFYADAGMPQGPVGLSELKALARDGRIGAETLYWRAGLDQWTAGSALPELGRLWRHDVESSPAAGSVTLPPRSRPDSPGPAPLLDPLAAASLALNLLCGVGNLAAIVVGALALRRVERSNGALRGRELAIAGMALGIAGLVATAFVAYRYLAHPAPGG